MKFGLLVITLLIASCAHNNQYAKIDRHEWVALTCSGILSWQNCWAEAQSICQNGFYYANQLENVLIQRRVVEVACRR